MKAMDVMVRDVVTVKPETDVASALLKPLPFATCWRKQDIPPRYRYGTNIRVAAIICQAVAGGEVT